MFNAIDTAALLVQLSIIVCAFFASPRVSIVVRLNCALVACLVICPTTLITHEVASLELGYVSPRALLYKLKLFYVGGFGVGPIYPILCLMVAINVAALYFSRELLRKFVGLVAALVAIALWGFVACLQNPYAVDVANVIYSLRELACAILGISGALVLVQERAEQYWISYAAKILAILVVVGSVPFVVASPDLRWQRDVSFNVLPSQASVLVCYVAFAFTVDRNRSWFLHAVFSVPLALAIFSFSKDAIFVAGALAGVLMIRPLRNFCIRRPCAAAVGVFCYLVAGYLATVVISHSLPSPLPSLEIRYFQLINVLKTLVGNGFTIAIFGLGWNQWYLIYDAFPFWDYFSGPAYEVENGEARFMVSMPFIPIARSIGILGLTVAGAVVGRVVCNVLRGGAVFGFTLSVVTAIMLSSVAMSAVTGSVEGVVIVAMFATLLSTKGAERML